MRLCFDATRFGCSLGDALHLAAQKCIPTIEYSFLPFVVTAKSKNLNGKELKHLNHIAKLSDKINVSIACLNLDFCLVPKDQRCAKQFKEMSIKLGQVASSINCPNIAVSILPGQDQSWIDSLVEDINAVQVMLKTINVRLLLRLSTPKKMRGLSLKKWQALEPQDWRDIISLCPELSLSLSPADCLWLGIDYLQILPGIISAVEHIEAHDVEINRALLSDSGLFGPLWWRYRIPGKGQIDWRQLIEALKLYDFRGTFSIHLDDEFVENDQENLEHALDTSTKLLSPLLQK